MTRLSLLPEGSAGCIRQIDAPAAEADRLKSMGLCVGRTVVVGRTGNPMLVKVFGSRLGVSSQLAEAVWVERKDPADCTAAGLPEASS